MNFEEAAQVIREAYKLDCQVKLIMRPCDAIDMAERIKEKREHERKFEEWIDKNFNFKIGEENDK